MFFPLLPFTLNMGLPKTGIRLLRGTPVLIRSKHPITYDQIPNATLIRCLVPRFAITPLGHKKENTKKMESLGLSPARTNKNTNMLVLKSKLVLLRGWQHLPPSPFGPGLQCKVSQPLVQHEAIFERDMERSGLTEFPSFRATLAQHTFSFSFFRAALRSPPVW